MEPMRESLSEALSGPEQKRRYVRRLFATIADRYDFITRFLSFGRDAAWKRRMIAMAAIVPGERVLDLACGTGDLAFLSAACGGRVTGLDVTPRMIDLARRKSGAPPATWIVGDMGALPVAASSFDVVTTGYGLRNVPDLPAAIAEISRVLAPGGRFYSLDFNRPQSAPVRAVYLAYLTLVGAGIGWLLHRDPDTYRYIPASIRRYPGAAGVVTLLTSAGFREARAVPVLGGFMTIHVARKPPAA
jgi:ubiquinone/menaquinone biosynthesis methyltransferase